MGGIPDRLQQGGLGRCPPSSSGTGVFWEQADRQEIVVDILAGDGEQEVARVNFSSTPNNSFLFIATNWVDATSGGVVASYSNYIAAKIVSGALELDPDDPGFYITFEGGENPPEGPAEELTVEGQEIVLSWLQETSLPSRVFLTLNSYAVTPGYDLESREE